MNIGTVLQPDSRFDFCLTVCFPLISFFPFLYPSKDTTQLLLVTSSLSLPVFEFHGLSLSFNDLDTFKEYCSGIL